MLFSNLVLAALGAAAASAHPTNTCPGPKREFGVIAIHSGEPVHLSGFNAAQSSIFAGLPNQNAQCERPDERFATFYLENGALYLYTPSSAEPQQMFVDRSGMGQGKIGYLTGDTSNPPPRFELTGWSINGHNHLQFAGKDLVACPGSIDNSYSIWASGFATPGHNENCIGIAARVQYTDSPNACVYT
ncbi:cell wall protein PhiA [Coccidioides immitis RS]|uniref:Cell wall protein PhiA n=2 Tax=Coccidioides immitis TaxID=5501 RepID=A0A0E1RXY9_COCIM|nr:cell wall protein PhiA [Coccidioides immitis RS]EAS34641.1 cell wall protein PhiA [Coccidioides immitis RS]KMU92508.1 cell wall protein PhiA [Coccidioides immitis H538.4]